MSDELDNSKSEFSRFLEKRGMRLTRQREVVFDRLFEREDHVSADELADILKQHDRGISKATVYRTLSLLVESGLVEANDFHTGYQVYEFRSSHEGHAHHDHILCVDGQRVVEFYSQELDGLVKRIAKRHGFEHLTHRLIVYARCSDGCESHHDEPAANDEWATVAGLERHVDRTDQRKKRSAQPVAKRAAGSKESRPARRPVRK